MTRKIRYGVIGCGMMGQEHLKNIALLDNTEVAAIFEPDAAMRADAGALCPAAQMKESLQDLLEQADLDCLLIASPNFTHATQIAQIAETRPLPLLVEKPLVTEAADIPRIERIAAAYPAPIWVAMEYRYMPPIAALLNSVKETTGGVTMLSIREHRFPFLKKVGDWNRFNAKTGGTFVEKCCHFFDLMRLVIGCAPTRVMASAAQSVNHLDESYDGKCPDMLDNGYVLVDFENGARAMLELCMFAEGARYQETISAIGARGKIEAFVPGPSRFWPNTLGAPPTAYLELSPRHPKAPEIRQTPVDKTLLDAGDHNGSTFYQHEGFLKLVKGLKADPDVTVQDGLWAVKMGLAAQQSAATGTAVML